MINKDYSWKCELCNKVYSNEEYTDEDEEKENPDYQEPSQCYECDNGDNYGICSNCYTYFENSDVTLCKECLKVSERVVEKIIEKPVYIQNGTTQTDSKVESMEEFEKRIMRS